MEATDVFELTEQGNVAAQVYVTDSSILGNIIFSLIDDASGRFEINSSTGEITVANSSLLDYNSAFSHNITVRVTDGGDASYDETLRVILVMSSILMGVGKRSRLPTSRVKRTHNILIQLAATRQHCTSIKISLCKHRSR